MCKGVTHVEEKNGEVLPAADFVLKHVPTYAWEELGVFPTEDERVRDGVVVDSVYLWGHERPFTLAIKPNENGTVNVEVFPRGKEGAVFARYLQDADTLKDVLKVLQGAAPEGRF